MVEATDPEESGRDVPASRRLLARVFWSVVLLHVAAVLAVVAASAGSGAWLLNRDNAYTRCERAVDGTSATPTQYKTVIKTVSNWPVTIECYKQPYGSDDDSIPVSRLNATVIQSAGYWSVVASFWLIPLSWVVLAATAFMAGVLGLIRRIRERPSSGDSSPVAVLQRRTESVEENK